MAKVKPPKQQSTAIVSLPSPPSRKAHEFLEAYNSWTYAAVNAIAQEVSNIKLHLYKRKIVRGQIEIEELHEHEALSLLQFVNPHMTHYQLYEVNQVYLELMGEGFWYLLRKDPGNINSPIEQIWPLRPDWVTVIPSDDFIKGYKYSPNGLIDPDAVEIATVDMIPFKYLNPLNPYRGKGAVQAAAMAIDTDQFSADWNRNFFFNSAVPYLILRTKKKPNPEETQRFLETWQAKFQGKTSSHKIAMLTGDWEDPFVFGDKLKDMDFIEQRKMMRDEILGTFRVGKSAINITEDVNRANAEASNLNFMERVITPKMIRFVAHLNEFLLPNWPNEDLFFDFDDPAPADQEMELKLYENGKNYWLTPNEIRERQNLTPLDGGDTIYMPFTLQPIESLVGGAVDAVKGLFGKGADQKKGIITMEAIKDKKGNIIRPARKFMMPIPPRKLKELRTTNTKKKIKDELKPDLMKLIANLMAEVKDGDKIQAKSLKGRGLGWDEEKRDTHWKAMVAKTDVYEKSMRQRLGKLFDEQQTEVVNNITNNLKHYAQIRRKGKEASFMFNMINENRKWKSILAPFIKEIVIDKGAEVFAFLGIPAQLDISQKAAAVYLSLDGVKFIKDVNQTTRDALKETLKDGLVKEEGIPELSKRVEEVFADAKGYRSKRIARTEVLRSTNFATEEAFRQSDVVEAKEWLTASDERVDDVCASLNGKVFALKDHSVDMPQHPNCRCTWIPVLKDK